MNNPFTSILDKILKNKNNKLLYVILIIGISVLFFSSIFSQGDKKTKTAPVPKSKTIAGDTLDLEGKLGTILSDIKGAGKVCVMITYENTGEKNLAYDTKQTDSKSDDVSGERTKTDNQNSLEKKTIITGESSPVVVEEICPKVKGVIVVADGAYDASIKESLSEATQAALDVAAYKVKVFVKR